MPPSTDEAVGAALAALADSTRRRLVECLVEADSGLSATVLAGGFPLSRQAVVKHLRVLHEAQIVDKTRRGKEVYYQVRLGALDESTQWLADLAACWDRRLSRVRAIAEASEASDR